MIRWIVFAAPLAAAQGPASVLVVVNENSPLSREIGEYYAQRRAIPAANICRIRASTEETITRAEFTRDIAGPLAMFLRRNLLDEKILYIVTTGGVPLRIKNIAGSVMSVDGASVDSELTLLYTDMHTGRPHAVTGSLPNPFFGKVSDTFSHPRFPIYLVTRLAAYDLDGVKAMIDRAQQAANRGKFVIDLKSPDDGEGDNWLRDAAIKLTAAHLPENRLVVDQSTNVIYDQSDVIGYASWGSNDRNRRRRFLGFHWLPGAIMTEFVSTNARTFARPPENWNIGDWDSPKAFFFNSPQTMTADYIQEGVTGASGHVDEPYLVMCPRPEFLLPAYYSGRNLAESYYLAIRALSWQNVVIGDPLCSIGKP